MYLQKFFRKKPVRELLPTQPVETVVIEPWWIVQAGYITEDDVKVGKSCHFCDAEAVIPLWHVTCDMCYTTCSVTPMLALHKSLISWPKGFCFHPEQMCLTVEKKIIDAIIDQGAAVAGQLDYKVLHSEFTALTLNNSISIKGKDHLYHRGPLLNQGCFWYKSEVFIYEVTDTSLV